MTVCMVLLLMVVLSPINHAHLIYRKAMTTASPNSGSWTVRGTVRNGTEQFLGIRYGVPPTGDLRFSPSTLWLPLEGSIYNADQYGPACWQPVAGGEANMSEDCLFLNIFVPADMPAETLLPVLVWIHGGGFIIGSGQTYPGDVLSSQTGTVVVTFNYRLGPLGLLSSSELYQTTGTYGSLNAIGDQIIALKWVETFISSFHGDPDQISVMGESAGGVSSGSILLSPVVTTSIHRLSVQSGPLFGMSPFSLSQGLEFSLSACKLSGYGECDLKKLRQAEASSLLNDLLQTGLAVMQRPASDYGFWPWSVDGYILPKLPQAMLTDIDTYPLNAQYILTGFTSMDGVISPPLNTGVPPLPSSSSQYNAYLQAYFGANQTQVELLGSLYYPISAFNGDAAQAWTQMNADACWVCPTIGLNRAIAQRASTALFTFSFLGSAPQLLSAHGGDVYYLFDMEFWALYFQAGWNSTLAEEMQEAWSSFAVSGKPVLPSSPSWAPFTAADSVMLLKAGGNTLVSNFPDQHHSNACDEFWLDTNQVTTPMLMQMCWEYPQPGWPESMKETMREHE